MKYLLILICLILPLFTFSNELTSYLDPNVSFCSPEQNKLLKEQLAKSSKPEMDYLTNTSKDTCLLSELQKEFKSDTWKSFCVSGEEAPSCFKEVLGKVHNKRPLGTSGLVLATAALMSIRLKEKTSGSESVKVIMKKALINDLTTVLKLFCTRYKPLATAPKDLIESDQKMTQGFRIKMSESADKLFESIKTQDPTGTQKLKSEYANALDCLK